MRGACCALLYCITPAVASARHVAGKSCSAAQHWMLQSNCQCLQLVGCILQIRSSQQQVRYLMQDDMGQV
jgi:hypothetical protein